jgi:hypothetical protein
MGEPRTSETGVGAVAGTAETRVPKSEVAHQSSWAFSGEAAGSNHAVKPGPVADGRYAMSCDDFRGDGFQDETHSQDSAGVGVEGHAMVGLSGKTTVRCRFPLRRGRKPSLEPSNRSGQRIRVPKGAGFEPGTPVKQFSRHTTTMSSRRAVGQKPRVRFASPQGSWKGTPAGYHAGRGVSGARRPRLRLPANGGSLHIGVPGGEIRAQYRQNAGGGLPERNGPEQQESVPSVCGKDMH